MVLFAVQMIREVFCVALFKIFWRMSNAYVCLRQSSTMKDGPVEKFIPKMDERTLTTSDGVRLRYLVAFDSDGTKPLMLLCPHLRQYHISGGFSTGIFVMMAFQHEYTFVTWEQRGNHGTTEPADPTHVGIDYDARDGLEVMRAAGYTKAGVLFGHSQGVQLGLEMVCQAPTCADKLVLCNGIIGRMCEYNFQIVPIPWIPTLYRAALDYAYEEAWLLILLSVVLRWMRPLMVPIVRAVAYLVADLRVPDAINLHMDLSEVFFVDCIADWKSLIRWLKKMDEHCTLSRLHTVKQPVLLLSGGLDLMTPCRAMFDMARRLPNCTHHCEWTATHVTITSHWTRTMKIIRDFLEKSDMDSSKSLTCANRKCMPRVR